MKIGELEIMRDSRQVLRDGKPVRLSSRAFDLFQLLLDANGAVIPTEEILAKVWPSTVVEENNIQVHICSLRRLLGANRHLIQTVSGRGYRMARPKTPDDKAASQPDREHHEPVSDTDFSLPHTSGPLFGRQTCMERLIATISQGDDAVITLTGPAGVGKSRLALEVARCFLDQGELVVAYLSLAACSGETEAYDTIGAALESVNVATRTARASVPTGPAALVILDNCDQLSQAVIRALARSATFRQTTRTVVLLTTRAPLKVSMEKVINIPSLLAVPPRGEVSAALEMFVSRVRSFDPRIETCNGFMETARHLVEQMDGLPLAIELAAHQTSMLGIDSIALLLEQQVDLAGSEMRRLSESRHESMAAALMWTWPNLSASSKTVLCGLLDAGAEADLHELRNIAERLGLLAENVLEAISELAESSFIVRAYSGSSVRYRIPHTVQRFLWQQLQTGRIAPVPTLAASRSPTREFSAGFHKT